MGCHVSGVFFCLSLLILITNVFDIMIEKETHRMSRQENEKNPQPKAEKTDNAAPLESRIHLLTIIGEVEGHESLGDRTKSTKYEEILPRLALIEDDDQIEGILILLHTVGGDVEAGLAIAEMIASLSKPTVSLVLGGGHSIGVPLAVSADYSFIVPSATMVLHPVRTNGMFIGVMQTYRNMEKTQDRITGFIAAHSDISTVIAVKALPGSIWLCHEGLHLHIGELTVRPHEPRLDLKRTRQHLRQLLAALKGAAQDAQTGGFR